MAIRPTHFLVLCRLARSAALALCLVLPAAASWAARSTFRSYGVDQGLAGLSGSCMLQDRAGYLLICSEHGLFEYDGRRFINLGPDQGLPEGQIVYDLTAMPDGRIAVGYAGEVFVSDAPTADANHAGVLRFQPVQRAGSVFFDQEPHQLAAWRDRLVRLTRTATVAIVTPRQGPARVESMGYAAREQTLLDGASAVFAVAGHLWETFADGRLCTADPGAVRCFGAADGLGGGAWVDAVQGAHGTVMFRSASSVATFDPATGGWHVVALPDQGTQYQNYHNQLTLFTSPAGEMMTQSDHGLDILGADGWRTLTVADGAPDGTVIGGLTDAGGQLWLRIEGRGLLRWLGYGRVTDLQRDEGLSADLAWQTVRSADGSLWVTTDAGVDRFTPDGRHLMPGGTYPGASFAIAMGPRGRIWTSRGTNSIRILDPLGGADTELPLPPVDSIKAGEGSTMWIGSERGLFRAEAGRGDPVTTRQSSARVTVNDMVSDKAGGVFYLADGRLRRHRRDGTDLPIAGPWPDGGFDPLEMAAEAGGALWVSGSGGLFRLLLSGDRLVSYQAVKTADIRSNAVTAVMVDHRGWVWAGTSLGLSVFDGRRWVSFDNNCGLVSDDIAQGGLREDPDGSVWVATGAGLSHILDPAGLFERPPLRAVISSADIGGARIGTNGMPVTDRALTLQFGTPDYGAERSVVFRYRLSGVDAGWVDSVSGAARYASVPPGRHVLTVIALDALTHRASPPVTLLVHVRAPWWRRWWSLLLWAACALAIGYGGLRIRLGALLARQRELQRHVDEATAQLRYLATHDNLTGLLNRYEVERRLAARLSIGRPGDESIVALIDLDHFKQINDRHGHLGGDDVLRTLGRLVSGAMRDGDYAGRYGGEEVLVVINDADGLGSQRIVELHRSIGHDVFEAATHAIHVTCSIGLAWARAGDNWETLIGRADRALYKAKQAGRDRVVEDRDRQRQATLAEADDPRCLRRL